MPDPKNPSTFFSENKQSNTTRFFKALRWIGRNPNHKQQEPFKVEQLTKKDLNKIAKKTKRCTIHYSGNCLGLSLAMFYNLKKGNIEISIGNTAPFYKGLELDSAMEEMILGSGHSFNKNMGSGGWGIRDGKIITEKANANNFVNQLLSAFYVNHEQRVFMIGTIGKRFSHMLNAVIVGSPERPEILFVDAWRSHHRVMTAEQFIKRYRHSRVLQACYFPQPLDHTIEPPKRGPNNDRHLTPPCNQSLLM